MSVHEAEGRGKALEAALSGLEEAVTEVVRELERLREALARAEAEGADLRGLLQKFTGGEVDAADLLEDLRRLQAENEELHGRLQDGREVVERIMARIRFLEETA